MSDVTRIDGLISFIRSKLSEVKFFILNAKTHFSVTAVPRTVL